MARPVTKSNLMNGNPLPFLKSCTFSPNYCFCFALYNLLIQFVVYLVAFDDRYHILVFQRDSISLNQQNKHVTTKFNIVFTFLSAFISF